jgi:hypothetical protein
MSDEVQALISVDEIVPGASVRMCVLDDLQYLCIRDTVMYFGGKKAQAATRTWERLPESRKQEVCTECTSFQFPGQGQVEQPVITFKGALKLIMWIGGEKAKDMRSAMVSILSRYYAGDGSLMDEIEANAQSSAPIPQMARASLAAEAPVQDEFALTHKRKLQELDISRQELAITRQQIENARAKEEIEILKRDSMREHIVKCTESYRELCGEDEVMDERACLILKDNFLNMVMVQGPAGQGLIANGDQDHKPISVSLIANEKKIKIPPNDHISIGAELKKRYAEKHGRPPGKHDQLCDGKMLKVNSYCNSDRPLFDEVFAWYAAKKAAAV